MRCHTRLRSGRPAIAITLLASPLLAPSPAHALPAQDDERPNVLLVLLDDLGFSDLGCYGGEIPTPNIDRLAAGGVRLTQMYTSARCCPSRASLLTGLHPHQAGVGSFAHREPDTSRGPAYAGHLNDRCLTIAEVLRAAGYRTTMAGKWHVSEPGPNERGFEEFYGFVHGYSQHQWDPAAYVRLPEDGDAEAPAGEGFYATDGFTDVSLAMLERSIADERPWFHYLAHSSPHFPLQAPRESVERFVETYRRGWDVLRAERYERQRALGLTTAGWTLPGRELVPVDEEAIANGYPGLPNPAWSELAPARHEDLAQRMAIFAAMVAHVDQGLGRILDLLEREGELEDTLIVLLSDNGACYEWGPFGFDGPSRTARTTLHQGDALRAMGGPGTWHAYGSGWANLGNTPLRLYKHFTHEGGLTTPCIVHWPAHVEPRAEWVREPAHLMDVLPTVCAATGAAYPPRGVDPDAVLPLEGANLLPVLAGRTLGERPLAFEHQGARALRLGRWKAVWGKRMPYEVRWELYDIAADRAETRDLAEEHPERLAELVAAWEEWARRVGAEPFAHEGR